MTSYPGPEQDRGIDRVCSKLQQLLRGMFSFLATKMNEMWAPHSAEEEPSSVTGQGSHTIAGAQNSKGLRHHLIQTLLPMEKMKLREVTSTCLGSHGY